MKVPDFLSKADQKLLLLAYMRGQRVKSFYVFMHKFTKLGGSVSSISMVLAVLLFGNSEWKRLGYLAALGLIGSTLISQVIKKFTKRFRPYLTFTEVEWLGKPMFDHSFPSGHTAAIFSISTAFSLYFPVWSIFFYGVALLVGASRVVLGVHYPSDVAAGMLVGIGSTLLSYLAIPLV